MPRRRSKTSEPAARKPATGRKRVSLARSPSRPPRDTPNVPIVHYAGSLEWVDGQPRAVGVPIRFDRSADIRLKDLMREVSNLPYDGEDPRFAGLTKGEAAIVQLVNAAANGDPDARREYLDRLMGRPVQNVKSLTLRASLEDFLDEIDRDPDAPPLPATPVDPNDPRLSFEAQVDDL